MFSFNSKRHTHTQTPKYVDRQTDRHRGRDRKDIGIGVCYGAI